MPAAVYNAGMYHTATAGQGVWASLDWLRLAYGGGIVLTALALRYLALTLLEGWVKHRHTRGAPEVNEPVLKAALGYGIILAGLVVGLIVARLPDAPYRLHTYAWRVLDTLLIIYGGALAYSNALSAIRAYLRRTRGESTSAQADRLLPVLRDLFRFSAVVLIVALALQVWGYSPSALLAGIGIGGLALAFAAQDMIANVFGSFVIHADHPFKPGDWVEVDGVSGIVEETGIRSTRIRTFDQCRVSIPNKLISEQKLLNWQALAQRRVRFHLSVSAANAPEAIERALADLRALVAGHPLTAEGQWLVYAEQLEDSKLGLLVQAFLDTAEYEPFLKTQEELMLGALKVLREHGVSLALPLEVQSEAQGPGRLGVPRADG
jgi:MscS family membrane protein